MTEFATVDWFGRWRTFIFSENTALLSPGPLDGMLPNLQAYINRTGSTAF